MTREEKIICKEFLNDADKTYSCNEYKLLMQLLEQEPTTKNDLGVTSGLEKNSKKLKNVNPIIDWNNCHTSEQLDSITTAKNDFAVDYIDRQATLDAIIKRLGIKNETYLLEAERAIYQQILAMPSVTPIRPKGHWIESDYGNMITQHRWYCSECGGMHNDPESGEWREVFDFKYDYCPLCGADMREVENGNDV